jgi:hypothetical protein
MLTEEEITAALDRVCKEIEDEPDIFVAAAVTKALESVEWQSRDSFPER